MAINTREDLTRIYSAFAYSIIFLKPLNNQFEKRCGKLLPSEVTQLLIMLKIPRKEKEKKFSVQSVYTMMHEKPDFIAETIKKIHGIGTKTSAQRQEEDDVPLDPYFNKDSVEKWYRPHSFKITESQYRKLCEGVYINNINGNKANLTYQKNQNYSKGNLVPFDNLKTDKMDVNNADTYEVRLKGGLISYNITSIKGMEVMHYFKRLWDKEKTMIAINNGEETKNYELTMLSNEFNAFKKQFLTKVDIVIQHAMQKFKSQNLDVEFEKVCIMPVASHSHFNEKMCEEIAHDNIGGFPIEIIDKDLLIKDISKLEKDNDFIEKNKDFYNSPFAVDSKFPTLQKSTLQHLDTKLNVFQTIETLSPLIDAMNEKCKTMLTQYYNYNNRINANPNLNPPRMLQKMAQNYMDYFDLYQEIKARGQYLDLTKGDNQYTHLQIDGIMQAINYTKGPSVEKRTDAIWQIVKPFLRGKTSKFGTSYYSLPLNMWQKHKFQIKDLPNSLRMGLRNIYTPNQNSEMLQNELEKTKNSVFVIFDDNISGGATLSDVCYQLKDLGIQYIVPITFGKMQVKNTYGVCVLNAPKNGYNY